MTETIKECADLLGFLDGSTPPVFEDYGADALRAGTVTADQGPHNPVTYEAPDAGTYDLTTPQGRAAWKDNAPEGDVLRQWAMTFLRDGTDGSVSFQMLEPEERKLVHYRFVQELSQMETAKKMGVSQMNVSRMERKILQKLRETLKQSMVG